MSWKRKLENPREYLPSQLVLASVLSGLLIIAAVVSFLYIRSNDSVEVSTTKIEQSATSPDSEPEVVVQEEELPTLDVVKLQSELDSWESAQSGSASVVITDLSGEVLATVNGDKEYFAASIYKVYVAYEGYRQVDLGAGDPDENYIGSSTRIECLDLMIRESDSPCAEKMWVEIGKQEITDRMVEYGTQNTSLVGITTSASDAALILSRIARGQGLSMQSQSSFLESMRTQVYRDALNSGFSEKVEVYNKIGFNLDLEYHDTAIIQLEDGRQYIVSVLTRGVGSSNIADLATRIEPVFINQ